MKSKRSSNLTVALKALVKEMTKRGQTDEGRASLMEALEPLISFVKREREIELQEVVFVKTNPIEGSRN